MRAGSLHAAKNEREGEREVHIKDYHRTRSAHSEMQECMGARYVIIYFE